MSGYPANDIEFEEVTIASARAEEGAGGWSIKRSDGWSFFVPKDSPIAPVQGMTARFYGKGIGFNVRGLFLDGQQVYYRTADEEREHQAIESFGKDAADWLARWDAGRVVWSIEMGGMGPGYEQCIQIMVAENVRHLLGAGIVPATLTEEERKAAWEAMRAASYTNPTIDNLGPSGAQAGAALGLAWQIFARGPRDVMEDPAVKDRHIQVCKNFPGASS